MKLSINLLYYYSQMNIDFHSRPTISKFRTFNEANILGEFAIVHEVVHMIAPSHGKVFKSFMLAYLPDWVERERLLRDYKRAKLNKAARAA
jgi:hypothetical protein